MRRIGRLHKCAGFLAAPQTDVEWADEKGDGYPQLYQIVHRYCINSNWLVLDVETVPLKLYYLCSVACAFLPVNTEAARAANTPS